MQRERQPRELAEAEAKARGAAVKRPVGRSMHAAPRTSLLLSPALQALPLWHPHRVSEDDKWVRGLLL